MARSNQSFNKREKEKQRAKQKQEKQEKMEERKSNLKKGKPLEEMMAYLDENGNLSSTPPDPPKKKVFNHEDIEIGVPQQQHNPEDDGPRTGTVSFFNSTKGFGSLQDRSTGERVFFHQSNAEEQLFEGDQLTFEVEMGPRGPVAINLKKIR